MALPPAQPAYILRGHAAQVHSTTFIRSNSRLVTGDADGWIVVWSLATKRATAVWRAHDGAILGSAAWGYDRLITHGKDNKLVVWKITEQDEEDFSVVLPVDDPAAHRKPPWLLHALQVNTLNFCSFAHCKAQAQIEQPEANSATKSDDVDELLLAVPNTISSETVDIFHLPSERRIYTISGDQSVKTGMVMAVAIFYSGPDLTVIAGYESGHTMVSRQVDCQNWQILYLSQAHTQPILSLDTIPNQSFYVTSSADAIIAKHPIPNLPNPTTIVPPKAAEPTITPIQPSSTEASLLSKGLVSSGRAENTRNHTRKVDIQMMPTKTSQTKHSGQQCLKVRSDGKIFATAGWDSRVRVYSVQTLKELAVLKWHKEGCYAVTFADVSDTGTVEDHEKSNKLKATDNELKKEGLTTISMTRSVVEKRILKAVTTHWLAAGSKDGKVSLWDIY